MSAAAEASSSSSSSTSDPSSSSSPSSSPAVSSTCASSGCAHDHPHFTSTLDALQSRITQLTSVHSNLFVQPPSLHRLALHTIIRSASTSRVDFVFYSDQLLR